MIQDNYWDFLSTQFSFWDKLSEQEKILMCENIVTVDYQKGSIVHNGNEDCIGILFVKKGQLRTYLLSEDGRDVTLYRLFQGDVCILSASCVMDIITFDVVIDAQEDTQVFLLNAHTYKQLKDNNVYFENFVYKLMAARFSEVIWTMEQILFMGIDKRLAIFLLDEVIRNNSNKIYMTHEKIARLMGSAREVISRMLKHFVSEGIVELARGSIIITDKVKLRKLTLK